MRAIGFSKPPKRNEINKYITDGIDHPGYRAYTTDDENESGILAQFDIEMGDHFGISVCGQFEEDDRFYPDFLTPYLDADSVSSNEELEVERRVDNSTFSGVCDDLRVGLTLIFRLRNIVEYLKHDHTTDDPLLGASCSLSALSTEGSVLLPIYKTPEDTRRKEATEERKRDLLSRARDGDENAMQDLSVEEMDTYSNILTHVQYEDVFTMVDSYLMPYGAECELYSILGEIKAFRSARNKITKEEVIILTVDCNGLQMDIGINRKDLYGEPDVGRRFKGVIWMMGRIFFPDGGSGDWKDSASAIIERPDSGENPGGSGTKNSENSGGNRSKDSETGSSKDLKKGKRKRKSADADSDVAGQSGDDSPAKS